MLLIAASIINLTSSHFNMLHFCPRNEIDTGPFEQVVGASERSKNAPNSRLQSIRVGTSLEPVFHYFAAPRISLLIVMFRLSLIHSILVVAALFVNGCTGSSPITEGIADSPWIQENSSREGGARFTFRAGDTLELYVLEDSTLDGKYPVRQTGDVIISRLGRVEAAGKTTREIESDIKARLQKTQLKEATVIVDTSTLFGDGMDASGRSKVAVYIYGQVAQQGLQEIPGVRGRTITCLDAVVHAGGFGPFANKKKATIVRKTIERGNYTLNVDLKAVEEGHARDVELQSGDIVKVPAKVFGFGL